MPSGSPSNGSCSPSGVCSIYRASQSFTSIWALPFGGANEFVRDRWWWEAAGASVGDAPAGDAPIIVTAAALAAAKPLRCQACHNQVISLEGKSGAGTAIPLVATIRLIAAIDLAAADLRVAAAALLAAAPHAAAA